MATVKVELNEVEVAMIREALHLKSMSVRRGINSSTASPAVKQALNSDMVQLVDLGRKFGGI